MKISKRNSCSPVISYCQKEKSLYIINQESGEKKKLSMDLSELLFLIAGWEAEKEHEIN